MEAISLRFIALRLEAIPLREFKNKRTMKLVHMIAEDVISQNHAGAKVQTLLFEGVILFGNMKA